MEMGTHYDWQKHNSIQRATSTGFTVGRLVNGIAAYWKRDEAKGSRWISDINEASVFDLPTATGFARTLGNYDVVDRATGEPVDLSKPTIESIRTLEPWDIEFRDLSGRRRNPNKGVCLRLVRQDISGWLQDVDDERRVIILTPVAYARTFSTRETAEAFAKRYTAFKKELGTVEFWTTTPNGDDLP